MAVQLHMEAVLFRVKIRQKSTPKHAQEDAKTMPKYVPDTPKVIPDMSKKCKKKLDFGLRG